MQEGCLLNPPKRLVVFFEVCKQEVLKIPTLTGHRVWKISPNVSQKRVHGCLWEPFVPSSAPSIPGMTGQWNSVRSRWNSRGLIPRKRGKEEVNKNTPLADQQGGKKVAQF